MTWGALWGSLWGSELTTLPIEATTLAALRSAFRTRIEGTTPDHTPTGSAATPWRWRRKDKIEDVPGSQRGYYLEISGQERELDGGVFTSSWASWEADLKIWTGYHTLPDDDFEDAKSADQRQLEVRLSNISGAIPGLLKIKDQGWEDGPESDRDARWGAHTFRISYLLDQP